MFTYRGHYMHAGNGCLSRKNVTLPYSIRFRRAQPCASFRCIHATNLHKSMDFFLVFCYYVKSIACISYKAYYFLIVYKPHMYISGRDPYEIGHHHQDGPVLGLRHLRRVLPETGARARRARQGARREWRSVHRLRPVRAALPGLCDFR